VSKGKYVPKSLTKEGLSYIVGDLLELPRAARHGLSYKIVTALIESMTQALKRGETIQIEGLGIFRPITRPPRKQAANYFFNLGKSSYFELIDLPERKVISFQPSKVLKRLLKESTLNEP
jgi:nucleoid DNA-binding protein